MNALMLACKMPEWVNFILQVIAAPLVAVVLVVWFARITVRHRYVTMIVGLFLLIIGCALHFKQGALLAPVCNTMSSFFPSRGDYGWVAQSDMNSGYSQLYYVFHIAVIVYVLSVLFALLGIGIVNVLSPTG